MLTMFCILPSMLMYEMYVVSYNKHPAESRLLFFKIKLVAYR